MEVSLNYDPMLAKLIVWAPDRATAIERMKRALQELNVGGVRTSAPAALLVLEEERFVEGDFDTHFLNHLDLSTPRHGEDVLVAASAAIHRHLLMRRKALQTSDASRAAWATRSRGMLSPYPAHVSGNGGGA
jgi:acetyl/propionyl-CoA carboxylase alpha subunit